ncbi:hypothetical protein [Micromonospora sp. CA-248212]|uniref:hypothetical protein n=1 Tax=Micromonospora sp. CA-248212 TaxID=3239961 RepID=UPI003D918ABC
MTAHLVRDDTFTALTVTDPSGATLNVERTDDGRLSGWIAPPGSNDGPSVQLDEADAISLSAFVAPAARPAPAEHVTCVQAGRVRGDNESLRRANQAFIGENARLRNNLAYLAGEAVDEAERWAAMRPAEANQALEALIDAVRRTAGVVPEGERARQVNA